METNFPLIGIEECFSLFSDDFQYISTNRIAPSITYALSDENIEKT